MPDTRSTGAAALAAPAPSDALAVRLAHVTKLLLDDAINLSTLDRLRLTRELAGIRKALEANPGALQRLQLAKQLAAVRQKLGAGAPKPPEPPPIDLDGQIEQGKLERTSTAKFYEYDPDRKPAQRKRENAQAMAILARIKEGTLSADALTDEDKLALAKYSGTGGNLVGADGKKGSAYEYYTPKPIAEGMWALLREMGFKGGRTLDPCGGVGIFGATAPVNATVDAVELNETSGRVNQLVNDGPGYKTVIAPFEQVAAATPDETYDAIISNVPFGDVNDRGGNQFKDTKYRNEPIQNYFILRSLEKLRPGGLAAFITPPRCVSGKGGKEADLRLATSYMAEFMGAYRLPNSVFGTAAADTMTDVIVFRKYSREVLGKIEELRAQNPQVLVDANVMWQPYLGGTYFVEMPQNILGTLTRAKGRFGEVDFLQSDLSMQDIGRLLRKLPDSRVNWALLEATETTPIVYQEGDTIRHAGQTLQLKDGRWEVLRGAGSEEAAAELSEAVARCTTPMGAVISGLSYSEAVRIQTALVDAARALDAPDWLRGLLDQLSRVAAGERDAVWNAAIAGLACDQAFVEHQQDEFGFNYLEAYPVLSELMKRVVVDAARPPTALSKAVKTAMKKVVINYSKKDGFSGVWRGDVVQQADNRTAAQKFEAARYQAGGGAFVPLDVARQLYGEDFDLMADDEWCISADGQSAARADDYYVGNYADFLARIEADLAAATSNEVRDKLLRQKFAAEKRLLRTDPSQMQFTLFSPFVTLEERAEFIRRFIDPRFSVQYDEKTGKPFIGCDINTAKDENERNLKRFGQYLKNGTVSTATKRDEKEKNPELERMRVAKLRAMVQQAEAQFNTWTRANPVIMGRLEDLANDPQRLYFKQTDDDTPMQIPGLNPDWKPNPYQNVWVRKMGREFAGINGDGVGLGKTSQGLIAVAHAQAIGTKRRTGFVVPNSVLSNWRREAGRVYANTDDCLFVGLREAKGGKFKTDPAAYDADFNKVLEGRHSKVFMTYEAFQRLRLRESTAAAYDEFLARVDSSYAASDSKADDEKGKSLRAKLIDQLTTADSKSMAAPFFEDMGFDSLVIDEAHMLKNSRGTVEFGSAKFLSLADPSARGLDAQAKAWYVRKDAPRKDGVILLTATPITNSPLEIYSMLSLAVGDEKLNDLMVGIRGADDFMDVMCELENEDEETLDGLTKPYNVFKGLRNVDVLRNALAATSTIRTAEQVGEQIVMPGLEEKPTPIELPDEVTGMLLEYKEAFRFAIDTLSGKKEIRGSEEAYERVAAKFGEPMELIGHPFNLIQKMGLLIADPELDDRASFYTFLPAQAEKVQALVGTWNSKAPKEDRARPGPHTDPSAVVGRKTKRDGEDQIELLVVEARAKIVGNRVILDTMQADVQAAFDAAADKAGIDFDSKIPPKLAALIENFQFEEANPRGRVNGLASGRVRQLIFCDVLPLHSKIKRLLVKHCGVSPSSIAIITGTVNGKPEQILDVQEGFNEEGEGNKYRVIIANEKAEVGINLQKGTQAIHHLTLGWTPDSLTQRNGRGARQGNQTGMVKVYHYDAGGTFDSYKRMLVGKKSSWIDAVMDPNGGNSVAVTGGMSREQLERLIDSVGDADAMSREQSRAEAEERKARAVSTQGKQAVNIQTIKAQTAFLAKYADATKWAADKIGAYFTTLAQISTIQGRLDNPKASASAIVRNQGLLAELEARATGMRRAIDESVKVFKASGWGSNVTLAPATLQDVVDYARGRTYGELSKMPLPDRIARIVREAESFKFEVDETTPIGNEWRSEVDQAQAMIDSSREDFNRLGDQQGGFSPAVLQRNPAVIDGKVVCEGAFIERSGYLGVVLQERRGLMAHYVKEDGSTKRIAIADEIRKGTVTLPGAEGYDALITRAAQIEDAIGATGNLRGESLDELFSATVPEVAQRRSGELLVSYEAHRWYLPSPYFPVVVVADGLDPEARVAKAIADQQSAVIKKFDGTSYYGRFSCASSVAVTDQPPGGKWPMLRDFAKSRGLKLTMADHAALGGSRGSVLQDMRNPSQSTLDQAVIAGATTTEQLEQRLRAWLINDVFAQFDLEGTDTFKSGGPALVLNTWSFSLFQDYRRAIVAIEQAAARAAQQGTQPEPLKPADQTPVDTSDPERLVGIKGDTKTWKDQIKACATAVGGRAIWDGDALCWNVPFKAWTRLLEAYPRAEAALQVVESSGKTNYGRRR